MAKIEKHINKAEIWIASFEETGNDTDIDFARKLRMFFGSELDERRINKLKGLTKGVKYKEGTIWHATRKRVRKDGTIIHVRIRITIVNGKRVQKTLGRVKDEDL